jgi:hypothetical protein
VSNRLYGLEPARAPKEYKATEDMRQLIDYILAHGTQERGSRAGKPESQMDMPSSKREAEWQYGKPNSYASFPSVILYEDNYLKAVRPNYDDAPTVAWIQSEKLAKQFKEAQAISPHPFYVQEANVRRRPDKGELATSAGQSSAPSPKPPSLQVEHADADKTSLKPAVASQQPKPTENKSEPAKAPTAAHGGHGGDQNAAIHAWYDEHPDKDKLKDEEEEEETIEKKRTRLPKSRVRIPR